MLPTLTLDGEVEENKDILGSDVETSEHSVTINLTVPLYQSGSVYSRIREAKHSANQQLLEFAEETRQAQEQARSSWADLQSARARITSLQASVDAQEVAFEGVRQEAQVGSRTVLDVLDAEQELLNARVDLVRAQRDEVVASLSLASAVGLLSAEALNLDVPRYDVREHYQRVRGKWLGTSIGSPWRPADK